MDLGLKGERVLIADGTQSPGRAIRRADRVGFLAGAPASFVSGANLIVDGAITTRVQY